jgi:aryl-alcohol dehydrogenase-like predicted oxidoreductase
MFRCHPQTAKLLELIRGKAVGEVRLIRATFSFHAGFNPESRLFENALAGGGILDVGCYCTSASRLIAGAATGKDFAEPVEFKGAGHLGATGVDEWAVASLKFPGDILAQLSTGVALAQDNQLQVFGSEGSITVPWPWIPSREGGTTKILVQRKGQSAPEEILITTQEYLYGIEADAAATAIAQGRQEAIPPAMTWDDTLGNMRALDLWREQVGLTYEMEQPAAVRTVHGGALAVRKDHRMKYAPIAGVDKPVSRLVMGVDNQRTMPHAAVMFDEFLERGGNCWDCAYVYGGGSCERLLGQWIKNRGLRGQVVVLDKGAHTPFCTPEHLTSRLLESLDRLQTDYLDIYMMHRDNEDVPVGEFIDVLNEHKRAGRIRAFGGSNWTIARVEAANEYARKKGLTGFSAVSNNFSLAEMVNPVWAGCVHNSDAASRAWFTRTQTPLMPWSSQARGFFTGRADPNDRASDPSLARCWYSDANFRRRDRAYELARERGVEPIAIALAYVLCQPFPTFPLIGPRTLRELMTSLPALDVELSDDELRWLNLEA